MPTPEESADSNPDAAAVESALMQQTHDMIRERVGPHLAEHFDGFVVMGYAQTDKGMRRVVLYSDGKNPVMADALRGPLIIASKWGNGQL